MSLLFAWNETRHALGNDDMDQAHRAFIALVAATMQAGKDDFVPLLLRLQQHTQEHFAFEERLMDESAFPASGEHKAEHQRILGELHQLASRAQTGRTTLARAYVKDKLPEWFNLHTATMDSALAAHMKS